ncbi:MAG: hypothetical protein ACR2ME_03030 [Acidimicrobiia bacterium]
MARHPTTCWLISSAARCRLSWVVAALRGAPGVRDLAQRSGRWLVGVGWYLAALLGPTILTLLLAAALSGRAPLAAAADNWPQFFSLILPSLAFAFIISN